MSLSAPAVLPEASLQASTTFAHRAALQVLFGLGLGAAIMFGVMHLNSQAELRQATRTYLTTPANALRLRGASAEASSQMFNQRAPLRSASQPQSQVPPAGNLEAQQVVAAPMPLQKTQPLAQAPGLLLVAGLVAMVAYGLRQLFLGVQSLSASNERIAIAATTGDADAENPSGMVCIPNCDKCDGSGRIIGGIAALPWPFSLWPIKVYRPCPNFKGEYRRAGQTLDELVGSKVSAATPSPPRTGEVVPLKTKELKKDIAAVTENTPEPAKKEKAAGAPKGFGK